VGVAAAAQERGGGFFGLGVGLARVVGLVLRLLRSRGAGAEVGVGTREAEAVDREPPAEAAAMGVGQLGCEEWGQGRRVCRKRLLTRGTCSITEKWSPHGGGCAAG